MGCTDGETLEVRVMRAPQLSGPGATENNWIEYEQGPCLLGTHSLVGETSKKLTLC